MYIHDREDRTSLSFCAFTLDLRARIFCESFDHGPSRIKEDAYIVNFVPGRSKFSSILKNNLGLLSRLVGVIQESLYGIIIILLQRRNYRI